MSKLITEKDALIATFPYSLSRDTDKLKLAVTVADGLVEMSVQLEYAMIFQEWMSFLKRFLTFLL